MPRYGGLLKYEGHLLCWTIGAGLGIAFSSTPADDLTPLVNECRKSDLGNRNRAFADHRGGNNTTLPEQGPASEAWLQQAAAAAAQGTPKPSPSAQDEAQAAAAAARQVVLTQLREMLIPEALEKMLVGRGFDRKDDLNVVFIPTGCLALVPFAALLASDGKTPLIEQCTIATCPSLSHFETAMAQHTTPQHDAPKPGPALLVGNPSPMPKKYKPLPGAEEEVTQLAVDLNTPTVLIGPDATKAKALHLINGHDDSKKKKTSPCILHLATHGHHSDPPTTSRVDDNWDVQGHLVFADVKAIPNKTFLWAREIADWRLPATQLVVLSACTSHVGTFKEVKGGTPHDAAAGLSYAFLMAGVPRALVSLWPISDDHTKALMLHFYRHLKQLNGADAGVKDGVLPIMPFTTARALRLATRDLLRANPGIKDTHLLWAAFVVSGLP